MQVWALIVDSFRESLDRKVFWVMAGISVMIALVMGCFGFDEQRLSILFGVWDIDLSEFIAYSHSAAPAEVRAEFIANIVVTAMDVIFGWIGVMIALIGTAGFLPAFLDSGSIDVVLSKPISRTRLFLGKYLGSMVFVLLQAALFIVLTFLVAGLRWGVWLPGYLASIPLLVVLFSYLYCVSALVAVRTRSTIAAIFISIGAWVFFFGVQAFADATEMFPQLRDNKAVYNAAQVARWIVPKTGDVTYLATRWSGGGNTANFAPAPPPGQEEVMDRAKDLEQRRLEMNPWASIGSSLLFEAVVVGAAVWSFRRRDF